MNYSEVIRIAFSAIRANKLRSALTLLGIVVGVFSIIGVMTAVAVLENSIESGLMQLGSHTFQIQKFPVIRTGGRREWMKYRRRKDITFEQAQAVAEKITTAKYVGIEAYRNGRILKFGEQKSNPDVTLFGESPNGIPTNNWEIKEGRTLVESDLETSSMVIILGDRVVKKLFPKGDAIGQEIRVDSDRYKVIGTFESKGAGLGGNNDNFTVIPLTTFLQKYGKDRSLNIMIKSATPELYDDCMEEARFILRAARKVEPAQEDDFSIFSNDSMIQTFNDFTFYVKMGVAFISFVSLLAAGVGIMNIMLVSVTERTKEIGIRKAIGARKANILNQFIVEAIVLCQMGGVIGILLGILAGNLAAIALSIPAIFPVDWAAFGFALCTVIGIVFGVYPAWKAANLDPIEALRYE
ncbi:MAG: ABC transporter permease [bacterium]